MVDPTEETVVVVGGKYLDQLDKVMETVDQIRYETKKVPSAVFLFPDEKFDIDLHKLNITRRDVFSPTLVTLNVVSAFYLKIISRRFMHHAKYSAPQEELCLR